MKKTKILSTLILVSMMLFFTRTTHAYWSNSINTFQNNSQATILIGTWDFIETFDPQEDYSIGDQFIYEDSIWIITGSWFDPDKFLEPDGSINFSYVRPYGPIEENTNEWRSYNTYYTGDVVFHNGYNWIVRHGGANSAEPGTNTNAWNRLDPNWFMYNTYETNEIVIYNGQEWRALSGNQNKTPGQFAWAWELV